MDLIAVERELKKRLKYSYRWGRKQNDTWDRATAYIYSVKKFDEFYKTTERIYDSLNDKKVNRQDFFNYAANRWYNFWSAMAVEDIFCNIKGVKPSKNSKDKLVDFKINRMRFDHKTSVFPKGFNHSIKYAQEHKLELIHWLYQNQSQQQRKHLENRLFVIVYDENSKDHWKLKAEITWLREIIINYMNNFDKKKLPKLNLKSKWSVTYSDIVWAIKSGK